MSEVSIDILNDDCLLQILELLTLKERVKVELVCKRWQSLCHQLWKCTQKFILGIDAPEYYLFGEMFNEDILEPVLKLCGTNLKSLTVRDSVNNVLELIAQYCDSLNSLSFECCDLTDSGFEKFCAKVHSLTEVIFHNFGITDQQLDQIFISQPKLKFLELKELDYLCNPNFDKLNEELESIIIYNCECIDNDHIIRNLNKFKHLKKLYFFTTDALRINKLVREIPQIEHLAIEIFYHVNEELREIGGLKNLRSLILNLQGSITDNTMADIAENCHLLKCILIFGYFYSGTSEGLKRLSKLSKLKKIYMSGMKQINDDVLNMWATNGKLTHVDVSVCDNVTDTGVIALIKQCPYLQELNITRCKITMAALTMSKAMKIAKVNPLTPPYVFI